MASSPIKRYYKRIDSAIEAFGSQRGNTFISHIAVVNHNRTPASFAGSLRAAAEWFEAIAAGKVEERHGTIPNRDENKAGKSQESTHGI